MSEHQDPLLSFLFGELDQIAEALAFEEQLLVPVVPLAESHGATQTYSWSYRFTWQEVERGRRYVLPLDRERARSAQRPTIRQIVQQAMSQIDGDPADHVLPASDIRRRVRFNATLNVYAVAESISIGPVQLRPPKAIRGVADR